MDPQVAVASARDSPGHHGLDLLRHYTDIDFVAPDVTETIEAKSIIEVAHKNNVMFQLNIGPMATSTALALYRSATG